MEIKSDMDIISLKEGQKLTDKDVKRYLVKSKNVYLEDLKKQTSRPVTMKIMHIRDHSKDKVFCKDLRHKLKSLLKKNSSNSREAFRLKGEVIQCLTLEKKKRSVRKAVILDHRRRKLKRIWAKRGLPVDREDLLTAASKDAFDMSLLSESLPSSTVDDRLKIKAEKVTKEFLSFLQLRLQAFRKAEMIRILTSADPELKNNLPSSSSETHQRVSFTSILTKTYGDLKNVRIFPFRPLLKIKKDSSSNLDSKSISSLSKSISSLKLQESSISQKENKQGAQHFDRESNLQNEASKSKNVRLKWSKEMLVILQSQCAKIDELKSEKQKEKSKNEKHLLHQNHLPNPKHFQLIKNESDCERLKNVSVRFQHLHDSILLSRQMSRLKIANSKREDMDKSETKDSSLVQNKEKLAVEHKKEAVKNLRGKIRKRFLNTPYHLFLEQRYPFEVTKSTKKM